MNPGIIPQKILIIRLSSIGDIVLTTPLIRILKKRYPNCKIDYVVKKEYYDLLAHHPLISKIYRFDKYDGKNNLIQIKQFIKAENYDIIFDLHKNFRSYYLSVMSHAKQIVKYRKYGIKRWLLVNFKLNFYRKIIPVYQRYLDAYNLKYDHEGLDLYLPEDIIQKTNYDWYENNLRKYKLIIGICPGASFSTKRWTIEGFEEVIYYIINKYDAAVLLFGDKKDGKITSQLCMLHNNVFDFAGKYSLLETAALIRLCSLIITNDTGLMHISSAMNKKIVAIFGSTTEELGFFPVAYNTIIVQHENLRCRPCTHIGKQKCPKNHFKCMKDLSADKVKIAIDSLIA